MIKQLFYDWGGLNTAFFHAINDLYSPGMYETLMLVISALADHHNFVLYLIAIVIIAFIACKRGYGRPLAERKEQLSRWLGVIAVFAGSYIVDGILIKGLKSWFAFPRPFKVLPENTMHLVESAVEAHNHFASFPSGHASFATVLVASLWPLLGSTGRTLGIAFIFLVMFSRMALGVHFPADVTAGVLLSLLVVLIVRFMWQRPYIQNIVSPLMNKVLKI